MQKISMLQLGLIAPFYKFKTVFAVFGAISVGIFSGIGEHQAHANDRLFLSPVVTVEEHADSEVQAKKAALLSAKRKAFSHIVELMVPVRHRSRLPTLSQKTLENLVYTTDIPSERMSQGAGIYVADIQVGFRPDLVRDYFKANNVAFAETPSKRLLILPVLVRAGSTILWEDSNDWRQAWALQDLPSGLVPVTQPLGDISDMGVISGQQTMHADPERLMAIAKKYKAEGVLVTIVNESMLSSSQIPTISVSSSIIANGWDSEVVTYDFEGAPVVDGEAADFTILYQQAIETVYSGLQEKWKETNLIDPTARGSQLVLTAPLTKLRDWTAIRTMFEKLAMVQSIDLIDVTVEEAHVTVTFSGRSDALQSAVSQSDYALNYDVVEQLWVLKRAQ